MSLLSLLILILILFLILIPILILIYFSAIAAAVCTIFLLEGEEDRQTNMCSSVRSEPFVYVLSIYFTTIVRFDLLYHDIE